MSNSVSGRDFTAEVGRQRLQPADPGSRATRHDDAGIMVSSSRHEARRRSVSARSFSRRLFSDRADSRKRGNVSGSDHQRLLRRTTRRGDVALSRRGPAAAPHANRTGRDPRDDPRTSGGCLGSGVARRIRDGTAGPHDADEIARLYAKVFASYPFPITDPEYIISTMKTNVVYRIVRDGEGALVAAASAETMPPAPQRRDDRLRDPAAASAGSGSRSIFWQPSRTTWRSARFRISTRSPGPDRRA